MKTFILCFSAVLLAMSPAVLSAEDSDAGPPDVESLMTPEDFSRAGLDKLSEEERAHLSEWVERYREGATRGPVVQKAPSEMSEEERRAEKDFEVTAKVVPRFRGWSGRTIFKLDNGQVWQQRMRSSKLRYTGNDSEVLIRKNLFGGYVLEHLETGRAVPVKRVE